MFLERSVHSIGLVVNGVLRNTVYCLLLCFSLLLGKNGRPRAPNIIGIKSGPIRRHLGESPAGIEVPLTTLPVTVTGLRTVLFSELRQHCHTAAHWSVAPPMWRLSSRLEGITA